MMTDLGLKVRKLFFFSFLDLAISRLTKYVGFFILINFLNREMIGIIGIATGYLAFVRYLLIAPENILLRDYPRIQTNQKNLLQRLSTYLDFWLWKSIFVLLVGGLIFLFLKERNVVLGVVFLGLLIQVVLETFSNLLQLVFYVNFRQEKVTKINFYNNLVLLSLFIFLYFLPSIYTYLSIVIFGQLALCMIWFYLIKHHFKFTYHHLSGWFKMIKNDLASFTLWYHLSNSAIIFGQNVGPLILSFFSGLALVGDYTIALKISGLFLIIPQLLQKSTLVHFTHEGEIPLERKAKIPGTLYQYLAVHGLLSLAYLIFFGLFGKFFIYYFLTKQNVNFIFALALLMLGGIAVYNLARPLLAFVSAKFSLKTGFFVIYLPATIISFLIYFIFAKYFGAIGLASASIISYFILLIAALFFLLTQKGQLLEGRLLNPKI